MTCSPSRTPNGATSATPRGSMRRPSSTGWKSFDAVTVAPYMGRDAVTPFWAGLGKWAIVLGVTSNEGARLPVPGGERWSGPAVRGGGGPGGRRGSSDDTMFVAGATRPEVLAEVRRRVPDQLCWCPVGAQGGDLAR